MTITTGNVRESTDVPEKIMRLLQFMRLINGSRNNRMLGSLLPVS